MSYICLFFKFKEDSLGEPSSIFYLWDPEKDVPFSGIPVAKTVTSADKAVSLV